MLKKLLFSKVPTWALVTVAILGLLAMFGAGVLVNDDLSGKHRLGRISQTAASIARAPETVLAALKRGNRGAAGRTERFGDPAGWARGPATDALNGYVLLSRLDGDLGRTTVDLVDLTDFSTVYRWPVDAEALLDGAALLIGPDGQELERHSILEAMIDSGLRFLLFALKEPGFNPDPVHLNDIQPVPGDGPFWRKGDVFLSMRNISTIALFRPATGRIVWYKTAPWMAQHDIDIVDDTTISVSSNNTYDMGQSTHIDGTNVLECYDFTTGRVTTPLAAGFSEQDVIALTGKTCAPL